MCPFKSVLTFTICSVAQFCGKQEHDGVDRDHHRNRIEGDKSIQFTFDMVSIDYPFLVTIELSLLRSIPFTDATCPSLGPTRVHASVSKRIGHASVSNPFPPLVRGSIREVLPPCSLRVDILHALAG